MLPLEHRRKLEEGVVVATLAVVVLRTKTLDPKENSPLKFVMDIGINNGQILTP